MFEVIYKIPNDSFGKLIELAYSLPGEPALIYSHGIAFSARKDQVRKQMAVQTKFHASSSLEG